MGRVGREIAILVEIAADAIEKSVNRGRQAIEFVARSPEGQTFCQAAGMQPRSGVDDVGDGSRGAPGQPVTPYGRDKQRDRADDNEQLRDLLDIGLEWFERSADANYVPR